MKNQIVIAFSKFDLFYTKISQPSRIISGNLVIECKSVAFMFNIIYDVEHQPNFTLEKLTRVWKEEIIQLFFPLQNRSTST